MSGAAFAQATPPTESTRSTSKVIGTIPLQNEVDQVAGRELRARLVTIEPGGKLAAHTHDRRPTLEYVLQGTVIEVRDGVEIEHPQGDLVKGTQGVTHWWENRGTVTVILLPVDVYKP